MAWTTTIKGGDATDLSIIVAPIVSAIVAAIASAFGVYVAITNRLTKLETLIDTLRAEVEKHNSVIERTYRLEQDITNIYYRLDRLDKQNERD